MVEERPVRVERRLSAILAADVAGYSRLMHRDEEATHAKLTALLGDAVNPAIAEHGGRIVKNTGDGFLAEFPSVVEAVRAAVQFQTRVKEITTGDTEDRRIAFRVGINIGDVIVEPHDIFGDGVNIAARLESIAQPGGICISSSAYDHIRGRVGTEFADLGEQSLKNIAVPVRAYAIIWGGPSPKPAERPRLGPLSPPRLSIVVLPFTNLSGDPEQDYFVDGVTESLTTDLSRISGSFVIGRHTAFTYKGKAADLKKIGRELNVRYVLEGSVQRGGNRLRVNAQLVDAETGNNLWAERFEKPVPWLSIPATSRRWSARRGLKRRLGPTLCATTGSRTLRRPRQPQSGLCPMRRTMLGPIASWASSKCLLTARSKPSQNANGHWHWITIWPKLIASSVSPSFFSVAARKPRPISTRRFASLLAITTPSGG